MKYTAIFGGTFNPFHIGHYEMLSELCKKDWIDSVFVMPDNIPPHKVCDYIAADSDRIEMCKIACEDFDKAQLCLLEFERSGKSYTVDSILLLKERYPDRRFAVVCGADMIATLDTWHNYKLLFSETEFIAFNRADNKDFTDDVRRQEGLGARITVVDADITDVSSTELRNRLMPNLLPSKIYDYIIKKGLYNAK